MNKTGTTSTLNPSLSGPAVSSQSTYNIVSAASQTSSYTSPAPAPGTSIPGLGGDLSNASSLFSAAIAQVTSSPSVASSSTSSNFDTTGSNGSSFSSLTSLQSSPPSSTVAAISSNANSTVTPMQTQSAAPSIAYPNFTSVATSTKSAVRRRNVLNRNPRGRLTGRVGLLHPSNLTTSSSNDGMTTSDSVVFAAQPQGLQCPNYVPMEHQHNISVILQQTPLAEPHATAMGVKDISELPDLSPGAKFRPDMQLRLQESPLSISDHQHMRNYCMSIASEKPTLWATLLGEQLQMTHPEDFLGEKHVLVSGRLQQVPDCWRFDLLAARKQDPNAGQAGRPRTSFHTKDTIPVSHECIWSQIKDMITVEGGYSAFQAIVVEWAGSHQLEFGNILRKAGWCPRSETKAKAKAARFIMKEWSEDAQREHCRKVLRTRYPRFLRYVMNDRVWGWD